MDRFLRHARAAPRWLQAALGSLAGALLAALVIWMCARSSMSLCEREVRNGDLQRAVETCAATYRHTGNGHYLVWTAKAHLYLGELAEAEQVVHQILDRSLYIDRRGQVDASLYGDAHGTLSYTALRRNSISVAWMHAIVARIAHAFAGDDSGLARDAVSLSQASRQAGDFTAALQAADEALRLAQKLADSHIALVAYLARADALRRMGDSGGAAETLARAIERATEPCDKAWAHVKNAMCLIETGQDGLASLELATAAQANRHCDSHDVSVQIALNEAWLLRRKDPAGALARLDGAEKSDGELIETQLMRGYLAVDRGALAEADHHFSRAEAVGPSDADWPWELARARAELSELRGGLLGDLVAEFHYRRAVAMVATLRATARARSAYLVSSHRAPYDGLIALLARHGRWRDVLAVVLELDASDMLRATADQAVVRDHAALDLDTPAPRPVENPTLAVEDVVSAWRSRDLVIVIAPSRRELDPGHERAYRLRLADGQVTGEDVTDADAARKAADKLFADPGDQAAARALGSMIVPPGRSEATLHVLAIGSLGKVPLAALRNRDGTLILASRPLVRVLGLRATGPEASGAGPAVVIADARGDLPSAAAEGLVVAAALGSGAQVSGSGTASPANRDRLWAAHDAELLHIAGHVGVLGRWRVLHLADGDVDAAEMVQRGLAPHIAVLAGCGSAAATDEEGWGSIAAALLESGTAVVIATDRSIDDRASLALMRELYRQPDWRADPARALARVQQALDARAATSGDDETTKPRSWAAFSVLGRPPEIPRTSAANLPR